MENSTTKKITLATVKSFIEKNADNLYISSRNHFDGMVDCVVGTDNQDFKQVVRMKDPMNPGAFITDKHTLGVGGAWFVGSSHDYFEEYNDADFTGYEIANSCGRFILARRFSVPCQNCGGKRDVEALICSKCNVPEYGKLYSITGGKGQPCILNGNTWKESQVKV